MWSCRNSSNYCDSNLDIREAILQLLSVIRNGNSKFEQHSFKDRKLSEDILDRIDKLGGQRGTERKIDNISTFLLRWAMQFRTMHTPRSRGLKHSTYSRASTYTQGLQS